MVGGEERLDLGPGVFNRLFVGLTRGFTIFLHLVNLRGNDGLDLGFFVIGQGEFGREMIEHFVGYPGGIGRAILAAFAISFHHTAAETETTMPHAVALHAISIEAVFHHFGVAHHVSAAKAAVKVVEAVSKSFATGHAETSFSATESVVVVMPVMMTNKADHEQDQNNPVKSEADDGERP